MIRELKRGSLERKTILKGPNKRKNKRPGFFKVVLF